MALLDSGGARMRQRDEIRLPPAAEKFVRDVEQALTKRRETTVRFAVAETHDGEPCDCIDAAAKEMTLRVGDQVILTHTCHDGRVDKVTATILGVDVPEPPKPPAEHGRVSTVLRRTE